MSRTARHAKTSPPGTQRRFRWPRIAAVALGLSLAILFAWDPLCCAQAARELAQRDYEAADAWLARSFHLWNRGATAFWTARLNRKLLKQEAARQELARAKSLGFDSQRVHREELLQRAEAGQLDGIQSELQQMLLDPGDDGAELCEAFVNGLLINGVPQDAQVVIAAWKTDYPNDPQPYVTWGRWLESQLLAAEAEKEYQAALGLRSEFVPAHYALARLHFNRKEMPPARTHYATAARHMTASAAPRIGEARCLQQEGNAQHARSILNEVVAQDREQIDRSFALVQDPDPTLPAERLLGEICTGLGDYAAALPHLDAALQREPRDPTLRYLKAQCLQGLDRNDEAKELFQQVAADREAITEADRLVDEIRQHPNEPQIEKRFRVGELFWKHDSARKAEYWLRSTVSFDPRHTAAHRLLAECYDLRADYDASAKAAATYHRREALK